jgi:hypothetical protein
MVNPIFGGKNSGSASFNWLRESHLPIFKIGNTQFHFLTKMQGSAQNFPVKCTRPAPDNHVIKQPLPPRFCLPPPDFPA